MDAQKLQELTQLTLEKRQLQADLKKVEDAIGELEPEVLSAMRFDQIQSVGVVHDGRRYLAYLATSTYAQVDPSLGLEKRLVFETWPDLLTLQYQRAASLLSENLALGNQEVLGKLAAVGILPLEKTRINIRKG